MSAVPTPHWGSMADAAAKRGCSVRTIERLIAAGKIDARRLGPKFIQVDLNSVQIKRGDA